jgi:FkbM family methyltransferase
VEESLTAGWRGVKSFAAKGLTSPIGSAVIAPLTRRRVRHKGLIFDTTHPAMTRRLRAQLFWGIYESAETDMIRRHLRGAECVLELGAGVGITASHVLAGMARGGRLICVEPYQSVWPGLAARVSERAAEAGVSFELIHKAISDRDESAQLDLGAHPETTGLATGAGRAREQVDTIPLSTLVSDLTLRSFALVSDIEGAEASFIVGPDEAGLDRCERMVIELHTTELNESHVEVADLLGALQERHGFGVIDCRGPVAALARREQPEATTSATPFADR